MALPRTIEMVKIVICSFASTMARCEECPPFLASLPYSARQSEPLGLFACSCANAFLGFDIAVFATDTFLSQRLSMAPRPAMGRRNSSSSMRITQQTNGRERVDRELALEIDSFYQ